MSICKASIRRYSSKIRLQCRRSTWRPACSSIRQARACGCKLQHSLPTVQQQGRPGVSTVTALSTKSEQSQQHELPSTAREESQLRDHLAVGEHLSVSEAETEEEFEQVGWLRARAFYETQPQTHFMGSFIRQFAQQEARSLGQRTQAPWGSPVPEAVCLVARLPSDQHSSASSSGNVIGTLDIRPPASAGGQHPQGVPRGERPDAKGAYILNVVVDVRWRKSGYGRLIMTLAEEFAQRRWGVKRLYAHVAQENEAALGLYMQLGFDIHEQPVSGSDVLLRKSL